MVNNSRLDNRVKQGCEPMVVSSRIKRRSRLLIAALLGVCMHGTAHAQNALPQVSGGAPSGVRLVSADNHQAVRMYQAAGFERYALQEEAGAAIFMSKPLQ